MAKLQQPASYLEQWRRPSWHILDSSDLLLLFELPLASCLCVQRPSFFESLNAWMAANRSLKGQDLNLVLMLLLPDSTIGNTQEEGKEVVDSYARKEACLRCYAASISPCFEPTWNIVGRIVRGIQFKCVTSTQSLYGPCMGTGFNHKQKQMSRAWMQRPFRG